MVTCSGTYMPQFVNLIVQDNLKNPQLEMILFYFVFLTGMKHFGYFARPKRNGADNYAKKPKLETSPANDEVILRG